MTESKCPRCASKDEKTIKGLFLEAFDSNEKKYEHFSIKFLGNLAFGVHDEQSTAKEFLELRPRLSNANEKIKELAKEAIDLIVAEPEINQAFLRYRFEEILALLSTEPENGDKERPTELFTADELSLLKRLVSFDMGHYGIEVNKQNHRKILRKLDFTLIVPPLLSTEPEKSCETCGGSGKVERHCDEKCEHYKKGSCQHRTMSEDWICDMPDYVCPSCKDTGKAEPQPTENKKWTKDININPKKSITTACPLHQDGVVFEDTPTYKNIPTEAEEFVEEVKDELEYNPSLSSGHAITAYDWLVDKLEKSCNLIGKLTTELICIKNLLDIYAEFGRTFDEVSLPQIAQRIADILCDLSAANEKIEKMEKTIKTMEKKNVQR